MTRLAVYRAALDGLAQKSRLRKLAPRAGLDFVSNDYLGLATSLRLREAMAKAVARGVPIGAGGSRLLRGNAPEHEELEASPAAFFHSERTLYFGSGYVANYAVLSTLPQKGDFIVLDALAHASANEGARAGRAEFCFLISSTDRPGCSRLGANPSPEEWWASDHPSRAGRDCAGIV